jgi:uncharacterized membrane protein
MIYTVSLEINAPIERVVELFDNEENAFKWMKGLLAFDHISGDKGEAGAKSRMTFKRGKRDMQMLETIESKDLPDEMVMTYEAGPVFNRVVNRFKKKDDSSTVYETENEFIFKSWGMKAMAYLMPGAFKKQSLKYLEDFKAFVEEASDNS